MPVKSIKIPDKTYLNRLFSYDQRKGLLIWNWRPQEDFPSIMSWKTWNTKFSGKIAGIIRAFGYRTLTIDRKRYRASRVIWTYHNGDIPHDLQVDHINGIRDDDRIENLRLVTHQENQKNMKIKKNNKTGYPGVHFCNKLEKFIARARINGKKVTLGKFDDPEEAWKLYAEAARNNNYTERHIVGK